MKKTVESKLKKYGNGLGNLDKLKTTCLDRYGKPSVYRYGSEEFAKLMLDRYQALNTVKYRGASYEKYLSSYHSTCMEKYGVPHPMKLDGVMELSLENRAKSYRYDGRTFDSKPEIALYVWLVDNNAEFEFHNGFFYEFEFENARHRFYPDFKVGSEYWEIKGDHLVKADGTWQNPFDHSKDRIFEAKRQCAVRNGVRILYSKDYQAYLDYVSGKYGKHWLDQFRSPE